MPTYRAVTLASGRRVSLGVYVAAWRKCREMVAEGRGHIWLRETPCSPTGGTVAEALADFRKGAIDRLNHHVPARTGRKLSDDWQRAAREVAYRMPRRIVTRERDCPKELRPRLEHRLYRDDE